MGYPSFEEYTDALRLPPGAVFQDPVLAAGSVRKSAAGVPFARSGNFALTYEVSVNGARYAVRCFHKEADSLERRYDAIARKLKSIASPYFMEFDFLPGGIRTESGQFPIVRMKWADGRSLAQFISDHRDDPHTLRQLRDTLRGLARHLESNDIGHGDIQPGNIIVRSATDLKLIDYDGMYVPELEPWGSTELGQRNFQHPGRSWLHFDERLDRFSFAVLDVALEALAMQPALWELTGSDEAGIVLRAADFSHPAASTAFGVLTELDGVALRARQLAAVCRSPFERVPALDDFLAGRRIPGGAALTLASGSNASKPAYIPAYAVLDATNFARCCAHIGDRIELIGRARRIVRDGASDGSTAALRVEFGDAREDMVRLAIWPEVGAPGIPGLEPGQWLSAIGLVDPILTETNEDHPYKSVSIAITEPPQLRLLTESEALYRLAADAAPSRPNDDISVIIGTDPAIPGVLSRPEPQTPPSTIATPAALFESPQVATANVANTAAVVDPAPVIPAPAAPAARVTSVRVTPETRPAEHPPAAASYVPKPAPPTPEPAARAARPPRARPRFNWQPPRFAQIRWLDLASLAARWSALRATLPDVRTTRVGNELRRRADALLRQASTSNLPARLRSAHPAWWLVAGLTVLVLIQSWIIARQPEVESVIADETQPAVPSGADATAVESSDEDAADDANAEPDAKPKAVTRPPTKTATPRPLKAVNPPASAVAAIPRAAPRARLLAFENLRSARRPIATIAGPIDVVTRSGSPSVSVVTVNGTVLDESRAEINVLAHRSVYSDREVIVGFSDCASPTPACERKEPFWLLLRRGTPPVLKRSTGLRANQGAGSVTAATSGVHVDLGLWDGVRQTATLTSLDGIYVARVSERPAPLGRDECRSVTAALESCAASRDCGSYDAIVRSVPAARMAIVKRLFRETTGLNAQMFRTVCVRSCELGLTPTNSLVRREVCGGAAPGQWTQVSLDGGS